MNEDRLESLLKKVCGRIGQFAPNYDIKNTADSPRAEYEDRLARCLYHAMRMDNCRTDTLEDFVNVNPILFAVVDLLPTRKNPVAYLKTAFKNEVRKQWEKPDDIISYSDHSPETPISSFCAAGRELRRHKLAQLLDIPIERVPEWEKQMMKHAREQLEQNPDFYREMMWPDRTDLLNYSADIREKNIAYLAKQFTNEEISAKTGESVEDVRRTIYELGHRGYVKNIALDVIHLWPNGKPITPMQRNEIRWLHKVKKMPTKRIAAKYHCPVHFITFILEAA